LTNIHRAIKERNIGKNNVTNPDMSDIIDYVKTNKLEIDEKDIEKASRVVASFSGVENLSMNSSDKQVFADVWTNISSENDHNMRNNLTEIFVKQLASGVENGVVVCNTGKISRMLSTFDGVKEDISVKPMWAIKEEMSVLASKVRDDVLKDAPENERESYENGSDNTGLEQKMIKEFRNIVTKDYIENGPKLNKTIMEPIISSYEEGF
jgi:hypothetical protein